MPDYLATVRDADGRETTVNVEADTADEAVRMLREQGFEEVVLHTDDVMSRYSNQRKVAADFSPRDWVQLRSLPPGLGLFLIVAANSYRKLAFWMILLALVVGFSVFRGGPLNWLDWSCLGVLAFPAVFALGIALFSRGVPYRAMMDALHWGRWEEAISQADAMGSKVPAETIGFEKARALAALGRLDEARDLVKPFDDERVMPRWLYLSRLANLFDIINRHDDAIALFEQALELAPDNAVIMLGLANRLILHRRDHRRARQLVAEARTHALSDETAPMADLLDGLILLEEGAPRDALPVVEAAYRVYRRRRHRFLGYVSLGQAAVSLARVHSALGDRDLAVKLYAKVRPRMVAVGSSLVARYDREIGLL
ncbi:tetratricopeptide repeat protein [Aquisphaera insulae]|uniref:tetratricopeptide repeat protein n=1 Tax=Aquisphaera insulae TaxID=2712864 RepID=UPI0013ED2B49|nr:tetratricopeptide repeat protein [Aquisphaera insulae]